MKILTLLVTVCMLPSWAISQKLETREDRKIRALELQGHALKQQRLDMRLDTAVQLSKQGSYLEANIIFASLLMEIETISSDMVYYFGKNSFYLKKYTQSIDWLNKYIQLKGVASKFSKNAMKYLKIAEEAVRQAQKKQSIHIASDLSQHSYITCGPTGKIICPVCKGTTVVIKREYTKNVYKTCSYCQYRGYFECSEYDKIIKEKLDKYYVN